MAEIQTAVDLLKKIKDGDVVTIFFKKKDGSDRLMKCTLNFNKIPKDKKPKDMKLENILALIKKNVLRVFDIEKQDWRSIPIENTQFVISHGSKYMINLKKEKE